MHLHASEICQQAANMLKKIQFTIWTKHEKKIPINSYIFKRI